ncbi:MAG: c-type cytochrome [Steroidobacteraceae bacterium]
MVALLVIALLWFFFGRLGDCCAPQTLGATQELPVERGRYLVGVANCQSCHTAQAGTPFAGGRPFRTTYGFFGAIYSSNITPDRDTGIGTWTEQDFIRAMRSGVAPGGRRLFPAFPYTSFTKLSTADIGAVYAYLRTIPATRSVPPKNSFWFRQRWVMRLWNALFFSAGGLALDSSKSSAWNEGRYLVEALGHCGACHTPRNLMLAERTRAQFTGGTHIDEVEAGKSRSWSAPNLTSADIGLAKWSVEDLKKYLTSGASRRAGVLGPMNEVIANSLRHLTDADAAAMAAYIKSLPAGGESSHQTLSMDERAAGQALYDKHCDECHLPAGRGGFRKAPPVASSPIVQAPDAASLLNVILYGAKPAAEMPDAFDAWEDMSGYKDKMTDTEIAQLANFLRTTWGNQGGRVSPKDVAAQR